MVSNMNKETWSLYAVVETSTTNHSVMRITFLLVIEINRPVANRDYSRLYAI